MESTTELQMRTFSFFTSRSVTSTSGRSFGCPGQLLSSYQRNWGPLNHCCTWSQPRSVFISWIPLDSRSAGFMFLWTCRHWLGVVLSWITCKRLATKVWNLREVFLRYRSTIVESVQNTTQLKGNSNSLRISLSTFTAKTAVSSNLGTVTILREATLDLPITRVQWMLSLECIPLVILQLGCSSTW